MGEHLVYQGNLLVDIGHSVWRLGIGVDVSIVFVCGFSWIEHDLCKTSAFIPVFFKWWLPLEFTYYFTYVFVIAYFRMGKLLKRTQGHYVIALTVICVQKIYFYCSTWKSGSLHHLNKTSGSKWVNSGGQWTFKDWQLSLQPPPPKKSNVVQEHLLQ